MYVFFFETLIRNLELLFLSSQAHLCAGFVPLNTSILIHLLSFWISCAFLNSATEKRLAKLNVNILAKLVFACRSRRWTRVALALLSLSRLLACLLSDMLSLLSCCEFAASAKLGWCGLVRGLSLCACVCVWVFVCGYLSASLRGVAAAALISLLLLLLLCCFVGLCCPCLDIQPCIYGGAVISLSV